MSHKHGNPDTNQKRVVAALRGMGFRVKIVTKITGFADLLVSGYNATIGRGDQILVELKVPGEVGRDALTDKEQEFAECWLGPYMITAWAHDVALWFGRVDGSYHEETVIQV